MEVGSIIPQATLYVTISGVPITAPPPLEKTKNAMRNLCFLIPNWPIFSMGSFHLFLHPR